MMCSWFTLFLFAYDYTDDVFVDFMICMISCSIYHVEFPVDPYHVCQLHSCWFASVYQLFDACFGYVGFMYMSWVSWLHMLMIHAFVDLIAMFDVYMLWCICRWFVILACFDVFTHVDRLYTSCLICYFKWITLFV